MRQGSQVWVGVLPLSLLAVGLEQVTSVPGLRGFQKVLPVPTVCEPLGRLPSTATHSSTPQTVAEWVLRWVFGSLGTVPAVGICLSANVPQGVSLSPAP